MSTQHPKGNDQRAFSYLAGVGVSHSIAPPMHNYVAKSLGYDWNFLAQECPTVEDAVSLFRAPTFAGGVVTMPYKVAIMKHLDGLDKHATLLKACNNVYRAADGSLRGTNTDWRGIKGCLKSATKSGTCDEGRGKPALIIGAGGASRAALYVLLREIACRPIYIVNRDADEVKALLEDAKAYRNADTSIEIIHLDSVDRAREVASVRGVPFYMVGTVPDLPPTTPSEIQARSILEFFFQSAVSDESGEVKGVLLDMCFKPRRTSTIKLAEKYDWTTVEGVGIIGHQIEEQYRLWCAPEMERDTTVVTDDIKKGAWVVLNSAAAESKLINY